MGKIVKLKNANNEYTYPVTKTEAVYIEDNKTTLKDYLDAMSITQSAGPAEVVTFNDGANNIPVKELTLNIEPHQEGSDDPSPDNVRGISGYQSINVIRAGKNLLENQAISRTNNGVTFTVNADGTITANGTATGGNASITLHQDAMRSGDRPMIMTGCPEGGAASVYRLRARNTEVSGAYFNDYGSGVEIPAGTTFDNVLVIVYEGQAVSNLTFKPMIRSASFTDAEYEPYQGDTYTITIPTAAGTVYGGSLVINEDGNGALTVNRGFVNLTGGSSEEWAESGADYYCRFRSAIFDGKTPTQNTDEILCNRFIGSNTQGMHTGTAGLAVRKAKFPDSVTSLAECVTWVQSNNLECVYPLATPQTYTLSAGQITTLLGTNTIWINTDGTISLTYRADLAKYITNIISSNQGD